LKDIKKFIKYIESSVSNPSKGLSDDIFYFIGRMTPYTNVDLLIKCPKRGLLLTWRDDNYAGRGWHIPGGIVRFRETIKDRVLKVGLEELNLLVSDYKGPILTSEIIVKDQVERSHFISLLYRCVISDDQFDKLDNASKKNEKIAFFKKKPDNLLKLHEIYSNFF
jgi:ADP-ribose pyrophosphatase YjhB (NUDIX family)|tara:strand:+ start:207 stop:701 length:495 start_codon:yes stop_codon:yes gene_type:complete